MTALVTDRRTPERSADRREFPVKASTTLFAGSMAAIGADDLAVPMSVATTLRGVGRCEGRIDNSTGADGDLTVKVGVGVYHYANSAAADEITAADIGGTCYGVDDQTVALTDGTGTRSIAGKIFDVDARGVWVDFR
ncbi:MAG: hypothetical protein ABJN98_06285 [Roseibium sp.]